MNEEAAKALRQPFDPSAIGKLPRVTQKDGSKSRCALCGGYLPPHIHLDYVGHAAVTDRLLAVDPEWSWEPLAFGEDGLPLIRREQNESKLWIKLTVAGTTRYGVGIASGFELEKQLISDAIRNAAMRFGVALDLWSKEDIHQDEPLPAPEPVATKHEVDLLKACIEELEPDERSQFMEWKSGHNFPWPWTVAAYNAMEAKLEEIVGAGAPSEATADGPADLPGPDEIEALSAFSDEPFLIDPSAPV